MTVTGGASGDLSCTIPLGGADPWLSVWPLCWWSSDPCTRRTRTSFAFAALTPDGPGTVEVRWQVTPAGSGGHAEASTPADDTATAHAWGPGARWLVARAGELVGIADHAHAATFDHAGNERLRRLHRQHPGLRIARTGLVWPHLLFTILGQRVTVEDAGWAWNRLCREWGSAAPGPLDLRLPPPPERLAAVGYADLHPLNVERARATTIIRCARELATHPAADLDEQLRRVERQVGVGPWTAASVRALALGDPDAIPPGDLHLPSIVAWALAGEPRADDVRMFELLEPYVGHRWRVVRLLYAGGVDLPRRGPKRPIRPISRR